MLNVGLKAFLWQQKSPEDRILRELWLLNDRSYQAYRSQIARFKEQTLSGSRDSKFSVPELTDSRSASNRSYNFSGVASIFDQGTACVTSLSFSPSNPSRLAWGGQDGSVRVAEGSSPFTLLHESSSHRAAVAYVAWSLESCLLLTADREGGVSLRTTPCFEIVRTVLITSSAIAGCCFHPRNSNTAIIACRGGEVHILNSSTGALRESRGRKQQLQSGISAFQSAQHLVLATDPSSVVHVYKWHTGGGQATIPLQRVASVQLPVAGRSPELRLAFTGLSSLAKGPALLVTALPSRELFILRLDARLGSLDVAERSRLSERSSSAAVFCPALRLGGPEYVAVGDSRGSVRVHAVGANELRTENEVAGHLAPVVHLAWSVDGDLLASGDESGTVIVWNRQ